MSWLSGIFGGNSKVNAPATPTYYTDPNFSGTQDFLKNYAEQGLQGNIPDWYKAIGEAMPEDLINGKSNSLNSSILGADMERQALRGTGRGGALSSDTMSAIGNADANLRYSDWVRAMTGRQQLMSGFGNMEMGVRDSAFKNQTDTNAFDQWKYGADLAQEKARAAQANSISTRAMGAISPALSFIGNGGLQDLFGGSSSSGSGLDLGELAGSTDVTGDFSNPDTGSKSLGFGKTSSGGTDWFSLIAKLVPMMMGA